MTDKELEVFQSQEYKELSKENLFKTISFLIKNGLEFSIICYTKPINFNPAIPEDVIKFDEIVLFNIMAYSFESCTVDKDNFSFEAGFGAENFGSILTMPLEAIIQINIGEDTLAINYYEPKVQEKKEKNNSMDILLNNPENLKLIKRNKR